MSLKSTTTAKLEAFAAKAVPRLPAKVVAKLAGEPLVIDARTLDPYIRLAVNQSTDGPAMSTLTPEVGRATARHAFAATNGARTAGVAVRDRTIPGPNGDLGVRLYHPSDAAGLLPGVLFMHQGGWVIGDLDSCDTFCTRVAAELGAVVVSLDYRLAPEHQLPAQHHDADAAWAWLTSNTEGLGIDPGGLVICGDSAGGQMATTLCQRLRDAGQPQPAVQAMIYPLTDATATNGSIVSCADSFPLSIDTMEWFFSHALPDGFDRSDPALSPALHKRLGDVAPAVIVTAGFDPLRDQGNAYAAALRDAGVTVIDRCEDSMSHSFLAFGGLSPVAHAATGRLISDINSLL
ncbi:MAG: acetyl esterase [Gammaproteobacteria bacterium]|jgi:acetyl esterase/lipase